MMICFYSLNAHVFYSNAHSENDHQKTFLDYLTMELSAHGSMLFAASVAAITFLMGSKKWLYTSIERSRIIGFMVVGGLLFAAMIYVAFRLIWYGCLVQGAIGTPLRAHTNLQNYSCLVHNNTVGNLSIPLLFIKHYASATSELFTDPFNGLLVSALLGIGFFAFVMKTFFGIEGKHNDLFNRVMFSALVWLSLSYIIPPDLLKWVVRPLLTYILYVVLAWFLTKQYLIRQIEWIEKKIIDRCFCFVGSEPFLTIALLVAAVYFCWLWSLREKLEPYSWYPMIFLAIVIAIIYCWNKRRSVSKPAPRK